MNGDDEKKDREDQEEAQKEFEKEHEPVRIVHEDHDPERDDREIRSWLGDALKSARQMKGAIVMLETDRGYEVLMAGYHHELETMVADVVERYDATVERLGADENPGLEHILEVGLRAMKTMRKVKRNEQVASAIREVMGADIEEVSFEDFLKMMNPRGGKL